MGAAIKEKAEEKVVAGKKQEAAEIAAEAAKATAVANKKKAAAEGMLKKISNAQCTKHPGCKGMAGYCCPTLNFNTMHLGSTKLEGAMLACCNGAMEKEFESAAELVSEGAPANFKVEGFDITSILFAFIAGSVVTAAALKLSTKVSSPEGYQNLGAA